MVRPDPFTPLPGEMIKITLVLLGQINFDYNPIPLPAYTFKGEEPYNSLPFKGRVRVGMG